jgi:chromosome segregation ATPase
MYDDRLMKSTQNMDALKQQLQHATQSHQEEVESISAQHEALIAKLHHECRVEVDKLSKDVARMSEEVARTEHMRQEMLSQQAEEYEKELAQQAAESLQTLLKRQSMIDSASTQVQTLKSKLEQQNRMNKDMRSKINFHQNENADMTNKHKSLEEEIKILRKVITDKDVQLKKAVEEMEEMKFHQAVLEKELYVTKTNMSELLRDRKPLEVSLQEEKKANESLQKQLQQAKSDNASLHRASDLQV